MKLVSDALKESLKKSTTQRKGRILVDDEYYDVYNVEYYQDAYNEGNVIGNAIASQLDFDLPYMPKFDTFKYFDGVWTGNEYEYVDMGTFHTFDEKDEDEFNKHITAFDNLIKFNSVFVSDDNYPKTLYEELQSVCEQANVELATESIPNGDFEIENNQFVNEETLKTVLKNICGISGTYAIIKEDKLNLQLKVETSESINKSEHTPITWKRKTYGINQVILGMADIEGEYVLRQDEDDIALNGVHKLIINDNLFAYTQEKREQLINELFEQVKGFGYYPYEMQIEWLNYLDVGDTINLDGIDTIVLRINGASPNSLKSTISAPSIIDAAIDYVNNTNDVENRLKRTEIVVDKQNQTITSVVSTTNKVVNDVANNSTNINNNYQDLLAKFEDYVPQSEFIEIETSVKQLQTDTYTKTEINTKLTDGSVTKVKTTSGTFDEDGMHYEKTDAPTSSTINEKGVEVEDSSKNDLLYAGYVDEEKTTQNTRLKDFEGQSVVYTQNAIVDNYFVMGTHTRMEDYETGTGVFYIGG